MAAISGGSPDNSHAWLVAIVGSLAMIFTYGTPIAYGILRDPFSRTFGLSPLALSGVFAVMLFALFIGSGLVGVFGVRYPSRPVLVCCGVVTALLGPALYVTGSLAGLTVVFGTLGLCLGTVFVLVASVVPRWFEARRGAATGLVFVGNGLSVTLLPPVWQYAIAAFGVRRSFLIVTWVTATAFLLAGLTCRRPPWANRSEATAEELVSWLRRLSGNRTFQLLFVGIGFSFAWYHLLAGYAVDLFVDRGLTRGVASATFGLIGGISIVSRIGSGFLGDFVGSRLAFLGSLCCTAVGVALLLVPARPAMIVAVILIGLGLGGTAALYVPLLMNIYSPERDTAVIGIFNVAAGIAVLGMPPLGTASVAYTGAFSGAVGLTLVVTVGAALSVAVGTSG